MQVTNLNIPHTAIVAEDDDTVTVCINANAEDKLHIHWVLNKRQSGYGWGETPVRLCIRTEWGIQERTVYEPPLLLP